MPGDTPQEAVTAFLQPLKRALCVLEGRGVIAVPRSGMYVKYKPCSWVLNASEGMKLGAIGTLYASMQFQVIDTDPGTNEFGKALRVTTLGYNYRLERPDGTDLWRMHWHPDGVSDIREPHLHTPPDLNVHRPCDRMTFETAIRWCIEDGAPLTCTVREAEDRLIEVEALHKLHCSWTSAHDRPDLRHPPRYSNKAGDTAVIRVTLNLPRSRPGLGGLNARGLLGRVVRRGAWGSPSADQGRFGRGGLGPAV